MDFLSWFKQPTTITGVASLLGGVSAGAAALASAPNGFAAAVGVGVFAATHLVVNDNTATDASKLAQSAVTAASGGQAGLITAAPTLFSEMFDLIRDLTNTPRTAPSAAAVASAAAAGAPAADIAASAKQVA